MLPALAPGRSAAAIAAHRARAVVVLPVAQKGPDIAESTRLTLMRHRACRLGSTSLPISDVRSDVGNRGITGLVSSRGAIAMQHPPRSDMRLGSGSAALARGVVGSGPSA